MMYALGIELEIELLSMKHKLWVNELLTEPKRSIYGVRKILPDEL